MGGRKRKDGEKQEEKRRNREIPHREKDNVWEGKGRTR